MSKQISVKSIKSSGESLKQMYNESVTYITNIGFKKIPVVSVTDKKNTVRTYLFTHGKEKIILEYCKDEYEEVLKVAFSPMEIKFVYDILLLRFNQLARNKENKIFIYK
jgi:hypothetical protein